MDVSAALEHFNRHGYVVLPNAIDSGVLAQTRKQIDRLIERFRLGDAPVRALGLSIGHAAESQPERNPGIHAPDWYGEPFIVGDLLACDEGLSRLVAEPAIWQLAAAVLETPLDQLVFHFSNLTRKPAHIGPAIGWHRDAGNRMFAAEDGHTVRIIVPLSDMGPGNGGTAIAEGSHRVPLVDKSTVDLALAIHPTVPAGGLLAIHSQVLHGGDGNRGPHDRDAIVLQFGVKDAVLTHCIEERFSLTGHQELSRIASAVGR